MRCRSARLFFLFFLVTRLSFAADGNSRHPFVSGTFYPSDPKELGRVIDGFLDKVADVPKIVEPVKLLILPHAGYVYSGQTAAYGYRLIQGKTYDTVILIGPYHKASFRGASVWKSGPWKTPLGEVPVDTDLADTIFKDRGEFQFTQDAHLAEHSLEVQLPFLQRVLKKFKIVPILISDPSPENVKSLAESIYKSIQGKNVLIIVSSDMSHYYPAADARAMDRDALELLKAQDPHALFRAIGSKSVEFCGHAAVLTALEISKLMTNTDLQVLNYSTSADVTHDPSRVVGYSTSVIVQNSAQSTVSQWKPSAGKWVGSDEQKKTLLDLARRTVETYVNTGSVYSFNAEDPLFKENRAVFVTIRKSGQLRGCIGSLLPESALGLAVRDMAIRAASQDPRFTPIQKEELTDLHYEVSVLSLPVKVKSADDIQLGKHGVIVRQSGRSGVFLPNVADELNYDKEVFLKELCTQKAGLAGNCWQDPRTDLYVFTADEFGEAVVK